MHKDPDHWLYRFSPEEWLRAAENELRRAHDSLSHRQQRPGLAGARRAAGMAWNALMALSDSPDEKYGRSYMDHLQALAKEATVPEALREAAKALVEAPLTQDLVPLRPDLHLVDQARVIVEHARAQLT